MGASRELPMWPPGLPKGEAPLLQDESEKPEVGKMRLRALPVSAPSRLGSLQSSEFGKGDATCRLVLD